MASDTILQDHEAERADRVGFVELFFDLVFVFAATQLSHRLVESKGFAEVAETGVMFLAIWSVWTATTWVTNWLDVERNSVRLLLFALMVGGLFQALAIPDAFRSSFDARAFVLVHVAMQVGRSLFVAWATRGEARFGRHFVRVLLWYAAAAPLWIAGAWRPGAEQLGWWAAAVAVEFAAPVLRYHVPGFGPSKAADYHVEPHHFAERCGLFIIIALGEGILIMGSTVGELTRNSGTLIAFTTALAGIMAMWWIYFSYSAEKGTEALERARHPGRLTRIVYVYLHIVLIGGLLVAAAGNEPLVSHPDDPAKPGEAILTVGGAALFLAGSMAIKRVVCGSFMRSHVVGLGALGAVASLSMGGAPLIAVAMAVTGVLVAVAVWEELSIRAQRRAQGRDVESGAEEDLELAEAR